MQTESLPKDGDRTEPEAPQPELTWRAILTGMVLGGLLSVCNIYVGLKAGLAFGTSIVAALAGYAIWAALHGLIPSACRRWGMLENNINQTASSAAASVASAGLVAPIPALTLLTGQTLAWHWMALWVFSVMLIGIVVAVPLRRQFVLAQRLPFPSGVAAAETLREIHAQGASSLSRLTMLAGAAVFAAAFNLVASFKALTALAFPFSIMGLSARSLTFSLNPTLVPIGIGGLIGFRACASLLLGAILAYGVIAPQLVARNVIRVPATVPLKSLPAGVALPSSSDPHASFDAERGVLSWPGRMSAEERDRLLALANDAAFAAAVGDLYQASRIAQPSYSRDLTPWLLWPGTTLMVVASLVSLALSWRSVVAVLTGWRASGAAGTETDDGLGSRRFLLAVLGVAALSIVLQTALFGIAWWAAILAVLLTLLLAMVAGRVVGETGVGAVGPVGKVTQLIFGFVSPASPVPNLMAANVTGGAASQCADLLGDLKCGHLLGASPRRQVVAQICGALAGALVGSAAYLILIPNPQEMLTQQDWPAPAAVIWKSVAELLVRGVGALPAGVQGAMLIAVAAGIALPLLERFGTQSIRPLVVSPVCIGLAFVLPAGITISIFIGGVIALALRSWSADWASRYLLPLLVGLIVGESLAGMGVSLVQLLGR